jgi:hypothetical protein
MKQEGYLESCKGPSCEVSCCSRGYSEALEEFKKSKRYELKVKMEDLGINIDIKDNRVHYKNCGDGEKCLILENFCDEEDIRSLVCKIFPYKPLNVTGGGIERDTIGIYLTLCPAAKSEEDIPESFTKNAIDAVRKHYFDIFDRTVDVIVVEKQQEC